MKLQMIIKSLINKPNVWWAMKLYHELCRTSLSKISLANRLAYQLKIKVLLSYHNQIDNKTWIEIQKLMFNDFKGESSVRSFCHDNKHKDSIFQLVSHSLLCQIFNFLPFHPRRRDQTAVWNSISLYHYLAVGHYFLACNFGFSLRYEKKNKNHSKLN